MIISSLEQFIGEVRRLIADDNIELAIEQLQNYLHSNVPALYNEVITQAARYRRLLRDERAGIITKERFDVAANRIARALLELLDELPTRVERRLTPLGSDIRFISEVASVPTDFTSEKILGVNNLKQISWLEFGVRVCKSVCRILTPNGLGTGFLVGPDTLMTNNHVISSAGVAANSVAEFDYEQDGNGQLLPTFRYGFDLTDFHTSALLDYTLVRMRPEPGKPPFEKWGQLRLNPNADPLPSEHVSIVQHPNGGLKQIVLTSNWVVATKPPVIQYTTDTMGGSSGSPVFNDSWQVVAIHHAAVEVKDGGKRRCLNEGILMSAIRADAGGRWPVGGLELTPGESL